MEAAASCKRPVGARRVWMASAGTRSTPEEVIGKLRQVEVLIWQGTLVADAIRAIVVTKPTYWD